MADSVSLARMLLAAGCAPGDVRRIIQKRFGELPAEVIIPELYVEVSREVGTVLSETVGEAVDDMVISPIKDLLDW